MMNNEDLIDANAGTDDEIIEGGVVESFDDLSFREDQHRAETSRKMSFLLVWIMAGSVGLHFVATAIFASVNNSEAVDALAKIFNMWLPVISGLVSSAATYYLTREGQK
jgi:hypothetical protein